MLHYLRIENLAIVTQLELDFNAGLTIITGETGAGKSILIDALGLVLGERADSSIVRQGCDVAQVNAIFSLSATLQQWLQERELNPVETVENADECIIRRSVNQNGRSRAYINDRPVSMQILREFGEQLVDIHGQHAHQSLLKTDMQRQLLDDMAPNRKTLEVVAKTYQAWRALKRELENLGGDTKEREARLALLRYQVQELAALELTPAALQTLEEDHRRLANAHQLLENCQRALSLLDDSETGSALTALNQTHEALAAVQTHDERLAPIVELAESAMIQTQEAASELRHYMQNLDIDPARLHEVEQQLATLQDMARKHKIPFAELPAYFEQLRQELDNLEHYEERANRLETEVAAALAAYQTAAAKLHQQREKTAKQLAKQIIANMQQLGMPGGQMQIGVTAQAEAPPNKLGTDAIEFLVSANPGQMPKPLHKVASGGELSRISLSIQVITAQRSGVASLVFDEVDVGIGGGVAEIVGQLLRRLGDNRQVLCITHLPQVACQGHQHLKVQKSAKKKHTHTEIRWLDTQERVEEVARMLGGVEITEQTLAHAQEMLQWHRQAELLPPQQAPLET